jgi:hypothetical protein
VDERTGRLPVALSFRNHRKAERAATATETDKDSTYFSTNADRAKNRVF